MNHHSTNSDKVLIAFNPRFFLPLKSLCQKKNPKNPNFKNSTIVFELESMNGGILQPKNLRHTTFKGAYYDGLSLKVGWKQKGNKDQYFQVYNHPVYGIGFYSSTFNTDVIGNPYAIYGFVKTPFRPTNDSRWSFNYNIGLGLSGNFKPYNKDSNPLNLAIGSRNNVFINLGVQSQYRIHSKWHAGLGVAFQHFSNGALALPNLGLNLIPVILSVSYSPNPNVTLHRDSVLQPYPKKWMLHLNHGIGWKQLNENIKTKYLKSTLGFYASKYVAYKWQIGGGVDLFYSSSGNLNEIAGDKSGTLGSKLSGGPSFYLVHVLNKQLTLNGNVGYYIHNQKFNIETSPIFYRAGARYYVYKNFNTGVSIKSHMAKADFIEWTIGYTFGRE